MKRLNKIVTCLLLSSTVLTGCYPGNAKPIDSQSTTSQDSSAFEITNPKLHSNITEDEFKSADTSSAAIGIIGTAHQWNADTVNTLFGVTENSIEEENSQTYSDTNIGYYYTFKNGNRLGYSNGIISFETGLGNLMTFYFNEEAAYISPSTYQKEYPEEEYNDFSKADALEMVKPYLDKLEIPVEKQPAIFTVNSESLNRIREIRIQGQGEDCPKIPDNCNMYHICYKIRINEKSLMPMQPFNYETNQEPMAWASLRVTVNKDGIQQFECVNMVDLDESKSSEINTCSASDAYIEVKTNLNNTVLGNETYMENIYFAYGLRVFDDTTFELIPLYHIGSYKVISEENYLNPHFVNAETGKER